MEGIRFTEAQKKLMIENCERELEEIEKRKNDLEDLLRKLKHGVNKSKTSPVVRTFTWKSISLSTLKELDEFVTTDEVYQAVIDKKPELMEEERRSIIGSVSAALSQLASKNEIAKLEIPYATGNLWGLMEWLVNNDAGKSIPKQTFIEKISSKGYQVPDDWYESEVEKDSDDLPF